MYGYDDLTRVTSGSCGAGWAQTFSFDPFGNITKAGSASFAPTYTSSPPANQFSQITGGPNGVTNYYDGNGNLKYDVTHSSYAWDANGNLLSVDGFAVTMIYDAFDRMIEQTRGTAHTQIVYSPQGSK